MSLKCQFLVLFLLTFTVSLSLHALLKSDTGTISGNVKDSTGAVLPRAQIKLQPGNTVVVSTGQGSYVISDVAPGAYTMTVTYLGFTAFTSPVTVVAGQTATVNAVLTVSSNSQQVTVHGELSGDAMALNEQKTSANILNVMTAPTIMSLPNQSVATALGRMPGVTVQINEGEPQYVQIRGTEPRLSNTTVDGVIVPGPDPQVRQVDLWVIPGDLVGSIAINKTLSANQNGDAIGGSVDLRVKQATSDRPVLSLESIGGYNPIDTGQESFRDAATGGMRFGQNKRWGAMLAYSYDLNNIGTDDVEPVPDFSPLDGSKTFDSIALQEYFYNHTRWGFGGSLDYKLSENSDLYVHGLLSNFKDYGQKFGYVITGIYDDGNPADYQPGSIEYSTSVRRPNYLISSLSMGGNHVFTHTYLKYQVAFGRSRFGNAAGNPGADFSSDTGGDCAYSPTATISIYRPQFRCGGDPIYDPTQYTLLDINLTSGQSTQINLQANGAYGILYHLGTHASTLEFGAQVRNAHKGQFATSPTYDCNGPTPCGNLPSMSQFTTNFKNPSYYGGSYQFGPITSFDLITKWLAANPGVLPLDVGATHLNSDPADYNLQERITAGYIMNTVELGPRMSLQTGLRIEATNESNTGYLVLLDANGNYVSTTPRQGSASYIDPMPSVQFRYNFDQNSDIRAVYGRGISRPNPYDLIPYATLDTSQNPNAVAIGNPALVAEHANDYDILYEKFLPSVGMVEAGYFYKQLSSPIFSQQKTVPNPFPSGTTPTAIQTQSVNGGHAHVQGIEMAYQQHLTFLPGVLAGGRISANFTYTESQSYGVPGVGSYVPPLVGQAPVSWNITPSYATKRALFTVGLSHDGANIASYNYQDGAAGGVKGPFGDNYYYERMQLDAQASYYIGKGFTAIASGENMNNAILGFYNGSKQYMTQREYYKPIYSGGLRWESKSMR
jgi:TonB-dependent receptor